MVLILCFIQSAAFIVTKLEANKPNTFKEADLDLLLSVVSNRANWPPIYFRRGATSLEKVNLDSPLLPHFLTCAVNSADES
jgi:hypothetical protein